MTMCGVISSGFPSVLDFECSSASGEYFRRQFNPCLPGITRRNL